MKKIIFCLNCSKKVILFPSQISAKSRKYDRKYCSRKCTFYYLYNVLKIKKSAKTKKLLSLSKMGNKNPMWVGDNVGYEAVHAWIRRNYKQPKMCEKCNIVPAYDLANKGVYDRNINNWEWLCRRCHMITDGRMKNLKQYSHAN